MKTVVILFILAALYFVIRVPNLTSQPIFADEAIYIRWAQVMKSEPTLRFVSLQDGKTPLFMWLMIPMFKVFADPLFAGRFLSVVSGFATLIGVYLLSRQVFGKQAAFWAGLLYAVVPYTVFFDRMALVDSMLAAFTVWTIFIAVSLLRHPRWDLAMILGYLLGGGLLVKTPAMLNLLALPTSIIGFRFGANYKPKLFRLALTWLVGIGIGLGIYNMLRIGPGFDHLSSRNADYVFSPAELSGRMLDPFIPHLHDIEEWFPKLLTWPILVLTIFGIGMIVIKRHRLGLAIILWLLVPLVLQMAFLKTFTARYILTTIPPLLIMAGFGMSQVINKFKLNAVIKIGLGLVWILPMALYIDHLLIRDISKANLPRNERQGYLEDWTAGYGFPEIAKYLIEQNKKAPIVVATEGFFGTLPDGLYIYLDKANIPIVGTNATISAQIRNSARVKDTYFVANQDGSIQVERVIKVMEFPKYRSPVKNKQGAIVLYKVLP